MQVEGPTHGLKAKASEFVLKVFFSRLPGGHLVLCADLQFVSEKPKTAKPQALTCLKSALSTVRKQWGKAKFSVETTLYGLASPVLMV